MVTGGETVEPNRMMDINKIKQNKKQQQHIYTNVMVNLSLVII